MTVRLMRDSGLRAAIRRPAQKDRAPSTSDKSPLRSRCVEAHLTPVASIGASRKVRRHGCDDGAPGRAKSLPTSQSRRQTGQPRIGGESSAIVQNVAASQSPSVDKVTALEKGETPDEPKPKRQCT